jgi:hypothetical protein
MVTAPEAPALSAPFLEIYMNLPVFAANACKRTKRLGKIS